jgi:hypothetical protein
VGRERDGLLLRYEYRDTDGTGKLAAEVRFAGFAGASEAWFSDEDLTSFADQLSTYPLGDSQLRIAGGYGADDDGFEEHVGLTVRALGRRGQIGVIAHLATPTDDQPHPGASPSEVSVAVLTSYEALARFSVELRLLVAGTADEARLDAEVLG